MEPQQPVRTPVSACLEWKSAARVDACWAAPRRRGTCAGLAAGLDPYAFILVLRSAFCAS